MATARETSYLGTMRLLLLLLVLVNARLYFGGHGRERFGRDDRIQVATQTFLVVRFHLYLLLLYVFGFFYLRLLLYLDLHLNHHPGLIFSVLCLIYLRLMPLLILLILLFCPPTLYRHMLERNCMVHNRSNQSQLRVHSYIKMRCIYQ